MVFDCRSLLSAGFKYISIPLGLKLQNRIIKLHELFESEFYRRQDVVVLQEDLITSQSVSILFALGLSPLWPKLLVPFLLVAEIIFHNICAVNDVLVVVHEINFARDEEEQDDENDHGGCDAEPGAYALIGLTSVP